MNHEYFSRPAVCTVLALLCCLLWGSAFPCIKVGYEWLEIEDTGSQLLFAGYRFFLAGLFTWVMGCIFEKRLMIIKKSSFLVIAGQGILQTALQYLFFYIGMAYTTGIKGSVIDASSVFISILAAHLILKSEKMTWRKAMGCLLGFAGVIVINFEPGAWSSDFSMMGDGMILLSAVVYGISTVTLKLISYRETPVCITAWQLTIGSLFLILMGFFMGGSLRGFDLRSVLLLSYMALLSTVAFSLWGILLKYNPVGKVSVFGFSIPVFGSLLSALILGEELFSLKNLAALVFVAIGVIIVNGAFSREQDTKSDK